MSHHMITLIRLFLHRAQVIQAVPENIDRDGSQQRVLVYMQDILIFACDTCIILVCITIYVLSYS